MPARNLMIIKHLKTAFVTRCSFIVHLMNENGQGGDSGQLTVDGGQLFLDLLLRTKKKS